MIDHLSDHLEEALKYIRVEKEDILQELKSFVSIPSISTDPEAEQERAARYES